MSQLSGNVRGQNGIIWGLIAAGGCFLTHVPIALSIIVVLFVGITAGGLTKPMVQR